MTDPTEKNNNKEEITKGLVKVNTDPEKQWNNYAKAPKYSKENAKCTIIAREQYEYETK